MYEVASVESVGDALRDPILPAYRESNHKQSVLRVEQGNCFFETFAAVQKKLQAQRRHDRKCGLRIDESEYDYIKALSGGAGLMEERASIVDMEAHFARIVGAFGMQMSSEAGDRRIDFHSIDAAPFRAQCGTHAVPGACSNDQHSSARRQDRVR